MKITPLDIEGHTFSRRMRGYDLDEVRSFLTLVSEEYEKLVVENHKLRDDVAKMQSILDEHRQREKILRETLYTDTCCHFNGEGNRIMAGGIAAALRESFPG